MIPEQESKIKEFKPKSKLKKIIENLFYIQEKRNFLLKTTRNNDESKRYSYEIIYEGNKTHSIPWGELAKLSKNDFGAIGELGRAQLEKDPNKKESLTNYEEITYIPDFFGIKRLERYLIGSK